MERREAAAVMDYLRGQPGIKPAADGNFKRVFRTACMRRGNVSRDARRWNRYHHPCFAAQESVGSAMIQEHEGR
jgi:hypothetical protein